MLGELLVVEGRSGWSGETCVNVVTLLGLDPVDHAVSGIVVQLIEALTQLGSIRPWPRDECT
jgi:hypothetical protein